MPEISAHPPRDFNSRPIGNRLLDTLDSAHLDDLLSHSISVSLNLSQIVHESNQFFKNIYFPTDGIISVLYVMEDGRQAEVSAIGCEGLVGSALTLGVDRTPGRAKVQVQGTTIRMEASQFTKPLSATRGFMYSSSTTFSLCSSTRPKRALATDCTRCISDLRASCCR